MAKVTVGFGLVLVLLGLFSYATTGYHPTALIPAWFGFAIAICGLLASTDDAKKRMLWMHIAVTLGLVGFLFPLVMALKALIRSHADGVALARPAAVHAQLEMALVCGIFVGFCVRSFIAARRSRVG